MASSKVKSKIKSLTTVKWIIFIILFLSLPILIYRYGLDLRGEHFARVEIAGQEFTVEVADTPKERMEGLSVKNTLGEKEGMLFVFEEEGIYGFWMKDMKFPIDIIWIKGNKVIGFDANVKSDSYPTTFYPPAAVDRVLELSEGAVNKFNINEGIEVLIK